MIAQTQAQADRQAGERTWSFPRRMIEDYLGLTVLVALGLFAVTTAIAFGIDYWDTLTGSIWDEAVSSASQWYAAVVTGIMAFNFLPAMIANGKTRRDFGIESLVYLGVFSAGTALLIAIGFLLERGLFAIMDWPQAIDESHFFSSSGQFHLIFVEYFVRILAWAAAGYLVGVGFYRSDEAGGAVLAFVWIPLMLFEFVMDSRTGSPIALLQLVIEPPSFHPVVAVAIGLVMIASVIAVAWRVIRDIPLRTTTE